MKKFIVLYHTPPKAREQMSKGTPEEMEKGMQAWMDWAKSCGSALVDLGTPLDKGCKIQSKSAITPTTSTVNGYSILQAEKIEDAQKLLKNHPHLNWFESCAIELFEAIPMD